VNAPGNTVGYLQMKNTHDAAIEEPEGEDVLGHYERRTQGRLTPF